MAIRVNTPVKVIDGHYADKTGKVIDIFETIGTAIVSFDDNGDVGKVSLSALIEIAPQDSKIVDVKIEIPEGAKKISRADFDAALAELTSPEKMLSGTSDGLVGFTKVLTAKIVGDGVRDKIFEDQDVVIMTGDDFAVALWDACNPINVSKKTGDKMGARKTVRVAITAIIVLEEIVDILFGAEDGK